MMDCRILIVTVLFKQKLESTNVFKTLLKGYEDVYIYDNSPAPQSSDITSNTPTDILSNTTPDIPPSWVYISDPSNQGLSTAYNQAAAYAKSHGYDWLLICDQDTIFPNDAISTYADYIKAYPDERMFVPKVRVPDNRFMSPVRCKNYLSKFTFETPSGVFNLKQFSIVNSGMLLNVDAFLRCGGYNEKVFLDFSDFQFTERFSHIYPTAVAMNITCTQNFSNLTDTKESKFRRFGLFCKSLSGYESDLRFGKQKITLIVLKRAISLCLQLKSFNPLYILHKNYRR